MKKRFRIVVSLLAVVLAWALLFPYSVMAADAVDLSRKGSVTIEVKDPDTGRLYADTAVVKIYRIAYLEKSSAGRVRLTALKDYSDFNLDIGNMTASQERNLASQLNQHINNKRIKAYDSKQESNGTFKFSDLELGLYLVTYKSSRDRITVSPFLITLPYARGNQTEWIYHRTTYPKYISTSVSSRVSSDRSDPGRPHVPSDLDEPSVPTTTIKPTQTPLAEGKLPQTGMMRWPILVLGILGIAFFATGCANLLLNGGERNPRK